MEFLACHASIISLAHASEVDLTVPRWTPRYRIRPGEAVPTVIQDRSRRLGTMIWGWPPERVLAPRLVSQRAEDLGSRPRRAFAQRCAVMATAYYLLLEGTHGVEPHAVVPHGLEPFAIAGLWKSLPVGSSAAAACTMLTSTACRELRQHQPRMPAILPLHVLGEWLHPATTMRRCQTLLEPCTFTTLEVYPVGMDVLGADDKESARMLQRLDERRDLQ